MSRIIQQHDDKILRLPRLLHDCGLLNVWTTDYMTITSDFGNIITLKDYKLEHDMANPAVANRPRFIPNDADFGGFGSLEFDGVDDYLYKVFASYRTGDTSGVVYAIIHNEVASKGWYFGVTDANGGNNHFSLTDNNRLNLAIRESGVLNPTLQVDNGIDLRPTLTPRIIAIASNGTTFEAYSDGELFLDFDISTGSDNGAWLSQFPGGILDNISIGATIRSAPQYGSQKQIMAGYGAYTSISEIKDCQNKLARHFNLPTLQNIVEDYGFLNAWSAEKRTVSDGGTGTTTTLHDYKGEHDLSNPAAANQPTLGKDADFGDRAVLTFDGVDDYLIKSGGGAENWRIGDDSGVMVCVFKSSGNGLQSLLTSGNEATSFQEQVELYTDQGTGSGEGSIEMQVGGGIRREKGVIDLDDSKAHVLIGASNGTIFKIFKDGILETASTNTNGEWWLNNVPNRDNIVLGAVVTSVFNYSDTTIAFAGYLPYTNDDDLVSMSNELCRYYDIPCLNNIIDKYNPTNAWAAENVFVDGTTTTAYDYLYEHDLANPAAANQPTFNASSSNFGGRPTLTFDGTDDYLIKNVADWRTGDTEGCFIGVAKVISGSAGRIIATSDTSAARTAALRLDSGGGNWLHNAGTVESGNVIGNEEPDAKTVVFAVLKVGSVLKVFVNGIDDTQSSNLTLWLGDLANRDNITIAAQIQSSNFFGNIEWAMSAYFSSITESNLISLQKELVDYYKVDTLRRIVERYDFSNAWSAENLSVAGSTTTCYDYLLEHDLANPAAANQPVLTASDADFGGKPSLTFDGTDDYLIKTGGAAANWRAGDDEGVMVVVCKAIDVDTRMFTTSDEASGSHISLYKSGSDTGGFVINAGTTENGQVISTNTILNKPVVFSAMYDGTEHYINFNGVSEAFTSDVLTDGWLSDMASIRDNIALGATIRSSQQYGNCKIAFAGYIPGVVSQETILNLHNELRAYYNL